jgi:UDP-3-O-[3-hydroxymyristoyl] N-acetylglucosamine deacetylase
MPETILIVDDEEPIRAAVRGVLGDEGFRVLEAPDGRGALEVLRHEQPVLVLLDIWMPEMDGIELLRRIRVHSPRSRVIVISGHGNIETAVRATQLGAADFIEKPFSLEGLLERVRRALGTTSVAPAMPSTADPVRGRGEERASPGNSVRAARTLARSVVAAGHGLHSGVRTGVILHPAPPGTGIVFESISSDVEIPARVEFVESTGYATTLRRGGVSVRTVEHLLAALHAFGITNLRVKMQGEIPILDGSALEFCALLDSGGVEIQDEVVEELEVRQTVSIGSPDGKYLALEPCDAFEVDYTLEYPPPVGRQRVIYRHLGPESFRREIAPARTFGFVKDIAMLEQMGLAGGGRLHNCILVADAGIVNTELRLENEFARHKILDILGDFYLLGRPIRGRVVARFTGHSENIALLRKVRALSSG